MQLVWVLCISIIASSSMAFVFADEYVVDYEDEDLWTMRLIAHSPEFGSTTASASQIWQTTFSIGPYFTVSSTSSETVTLSPSGGECAAEFVLATWRWEYILVGPLNGHHYEDRWRIIEDDPDTYYTKQIGYVADNCKYDVESFSYSGYDSIEFESQYVSSDASYDVESTTQYTQSISNNAYLTASLDVEIDVLGNTGSGTLAIQNKYGSTVTYTYTFTADHAWYVDEHGSTDYLWTFDNRW
jgi:hypothetical protein